MKWDYCKKPTKEEDLTAVRLRQLEGSVCLECFDELTQVIPVEGDIER